MKPSQWIGALVILIVIVFIGTFAMNYINPAKPPTTSPIEGPGPGPSIEPLAFPITTLPEDDSQQRTWIYHEDGKPGWVDFFYENPNAEDVSVGLINKNCVCTSVQVVLATPEWKYRRANLAEAKAKAELPLPGVAGAASFHAIKGHLPKVEEDKELQEMERATTPLATLVVKDGGGTESAKVPGKSVGWVRLSWNDNNKETTKRFSGSLWIGSPPPSGLHAELSAQVHFVNPVRHETTLKQLVDLNEADLEMADLRGKPFPTSIRVWSATRPSLSLQTEVIRPLRYDAKRFDPFEVRQPVPMTAAEIDELQSTVPAAGSVRCAYRIPILLHGISPDRKVRVDLGPFRRRFVLKSNANDGIQPMELTVVGTVQGNVQVGVGSAQDRGRLSMGVFNSSEGCSPSSLTLLAQAPGVDLEVDKERTPEFLRDSMRLDPDPLRKGDELPRWKLTVWVKPNAVRGTFPRPDAEMYHDGAVYLKVKGDVVQDIRIPVEGTGNER